MTCLILIYFNHHILVKTHGFGDCTLRKLTVTVLAVLQALFMKWVMKNSQPSHTCTICSTCMQMWHSIYASSIYVGCRVVPPSFVCWRINEFNISSTNHRIRLLKSVTFAIPNWGTEIHGSLMMYSHFSIVVNHVKPCETTMSYEGYHVYYWLVVSNMFYFP